MGDKSDLRRETEPLVREFLDTGGMIRTTPDTRRAQISCLVCNHRQLVPFGLAQRRQRCPKCHSNRVTIG